MRWYNEDIQLDYEPAALMAAIGIDPNIHAKSMHEIDMELDAESLAILEKHAAWGEDAWEDGGQIRRYVDQGLLARARREVESSDFEDLSVLLPSVRGLQSIRSRDSYGLDSIPLVLVFTIMILVALSSMELGLRLGRRSGDGTEHQSERPISTVAAAVLGMMAFVIALTFGSATNRFDARKTALLDDVTAIQTAYLRTSMLPEPHRTTMRSLLRDYVQARVGIVYALGVAPSRQRYFVQWTVFRRVSRPESSRRFRSRATGKATHGLTEAESGHGGARSLKDWASPTAIRTTDSSWVALVLLVASPGWIRRNGSIRQHPT